MFEKTKWPTHMLGLFLLLTGAVALVMPRGYSVGFYGICFLGLFLWFGVRTQLIDSNAMRFALPVLVYAAGQLLIGVLENFAWRSLDPVLPFGLMVFGLWALRHYRPNAVWFWVGLALGQLAYRVTKPSSWVRAQTGLRMPFSLATSRFCLAC